MKKHTSVYIHTHVHLHIWMFNEDKPKIIDGLMIKSSYKNVKSREMRGSQQLNSKQF